MGHFFTGLKTFLTPLPSDAGFLSPGQTHSPPPPLHPTTFLGVCQSAPPYSKETGAKLTAARATYREVTRATRGVLFTRPLIYQDSSKEKWSIQPQLHNLCDNGPFVYTGDKKLPPNLAFPQCLPLLKPVRSWKFSKFSLLYDSVQLVPQSSHQTCHMLFSWNLLVISNLSFKVPQVMSRARCSKVIGTQPPLSPSQNKYRGRL